MLAERELEKRADVYTRDSVAWGLVAIGEVEAAAEHMAGAVSEGTRDARLYLHAGVIAARYGDRRAADTWLRKAVAIEQMLLPSERHLLERELERLGVESASDRLVTTRLDQQERMH